jgi:hypothetical protein
MTADSPWASRKQTPFPKPAPRSGPKAKGGAAALRRRLFISGERPEARPWGGAFSTALSAPSLPKRRNKLSAPKPQQQRITEREIIARVLELHRHGDAYITLGRKDANGALKHTDSFRASSFETIFPQFVAEYLKDGHVGINAAIAARASVQESRHPGLSFDPMHINPVSNLTRQSFHRERYLRRLNACYVDIDCHKLTPPLAPAEVMKEVGRMCAGRELPRPTVVIHSGRGVWLLWHLHAESDPTRSHLGCQPDVIMRYKEINRAIGVKLAHVGADRGAVDAARLTGLPGTFKTKSQTEVIWSSYPGGCSYTLAELGDVLGVVDTRSKVERDALEESGRKKLSQRRSSGKQVSEKVRERCSRGWKKSASNRIACFSAIKSTRGGFNEGMRDKAAFVYAGCLRSACYPEQAARDLVRQMGATGCSPALSQSECDVRVRSAYSKLPDVNGRLTRPRPPLTYQEMANRLEVTVEESFEVSQVVGTYFPPQSGSGSVVNPPGQTEKKRRRHENIRAIMRVYGSVFSFEEILQQLAERGTPSCKGTLHKDLKALELDTPRMRQKVKTQPTRMLQWALK